MQNLIYPCILAGIDSNQGIGDVRSKSFPAHFTVTLVGHVCSNLRPFLIWMNRVISTGVAVT